jgi:hemerythrin-like domain-containing protein
MTDTLPLADTGDMVALHRVFRTALAATDNVVASVVPGGTQRAELVASYYDNVLRLLHAHHDAEDESLTPRLVLRCSAAERDEIERIAAQHTAVLYALDRVEVLLAAWRAEPTVQTARDLLSAFNKLRAVLTTHLDDEERVVLPIAAQHINVAEWGEMPEHAMRTYSGDKLWLVLGLIEEQMSAGQVQEMHAHMPPPLLEFWTVDGRALFTAFMSELHPA